MRRQARISGGGALIVRTASALQVWLWLLIYVFQNEFRISRSIQPGYLDFDNLPETNFTCTGKVIGGYYADLETSCQMFHVCTVGQQDEPMDIKFLCLNGTVFDQETRVCERVDEVDCTKSEKFYSLNLELYGSTIAPIIQPEPIKPQIHTTEQSILVDQNTHNSKGESDHSKETYSTTKPIQEITQSNFEDTIDSTDDTPQDAYQDDVHKINDKNHPTLSPANEYVTHHVEPVEENQEEEEEDSENPEYEDEYVSLAPSTTPAPTTTTYRTTTLATTTVRRIPTTTPTAPTHQPTVSSAQPSTQAAPSINPALLSPQEFIYHNRGPGTGAISFQRQGFRPADGVYITHAPPQQFDHFQYESSRTAPRPIISRPAPFVPRPAPSPFRATTQDPRDQILRPGPSSQSSERHETAIKHRQPYPSLQPHLQTHSQLHPHPSLQPHLSLQSHPSLQPYPSLQPLPVQRPLPFDPFFFKRSDDSVLNSETSLTARSAIPPTITERQQPKPKSPPRVIVTASASVSDSNGKRLNYTVGNVVSAVKPIVQINYDDYKESDLIFDPFFLDVPKLQKRRKTRADAKKVVAIPASSVPSTSETLPQTTTTVSPGTPTVTTPVPAKPTTTVTTTTPWNPNDYVDDNYEPHAYLSPVPPITYLFPLDKHKSTHESQSHSNFVDAKLNKNEKEKARRLEQSKPSLSVARTQISSSQSPAASSTTVTQPTAVTACAKLHDCRSRA